MEDFGGSSGEASNSSNLQMALNRSSNHFGTLFATPAAASHLMPANSAKAMEWTHPGFLCASVCTFVRLSIQNSFVAAVNAHLLSAVCRALKTKSNTPKYGLIYHSSFIGRAKQKNKGRISRYLANKCSIASRFGVPLHSIKSPH